ncbi:interleukin-8-like [Scyliorhinus canicula]|uniref:interleukin-8-like n=1 Tax=Scyliorhinus canicula TaxID=7830 RepID=UPI0018F51A67|nr:interleukin-8-like [Scyliorhinus canicula]
MNSRTIFIALTLLMLSGHLTDARALGLVRMDLRCKCININQIYISPRHMKNIKIMPRGPHCPKVEIIATLQKGKEVCLNPESPWVMKLVAMLLKRKENL